MVKTLLTPGVALLLASSLTAQERVSADDMARVDLAIREAFAFLYTLPSDTAAARMGSWVLDSSSTAATVANQRRILATKLTDTGQDLKLSDVAGQPGNSPAQLAAAMAAMQKLEGKISKAEAEAALEVVVAINEPEISLSGISDDARRTTVAIVGAQLAVRIDGDWMRLDDRELDIDYERWSPATLIVGFGPFAPLETHRATAKESAATFSTKTRLRSGMPGIHAIAVTAQGNAEMLDRVIKATNWSALARLIN